MIACTQGLPITTSINIYCVGYMSTHDAVCCFSNARFSSGLNIKSGLSLQNDSQSKDFGVAMILVLEWVTQYNSV